MRFLLTATALLLVAPAVGAQPSDSTASPPRLVEAQPPHRQGQTAAAASLGALGGGAVGGAAVAAVYVVVCPDILSDCFDSLGDMVLVASVVGISLGAAAGASLDRDRSFWRSLGGSALGQAAGFGVGLLVREATGSDLGYLAVPVGAVGGATLGTR